MKIYNKSDYIYTPLFCEENIWHLANSLIQEGIDAKDLEVIFMSNPGRHIVLLQQYAVASSDPVIWDYHVVLR